MFKSKSAWFSSSVSPECHNFWIKQGGTIAGWRRADYLFSEYATCPDTLRIFESKYFLHEKVTVFHSLFLSTCERRQSFKSVCIGHYVLPPASVQDEVRHVVGRLIWESEAQCSQDEFTEGDISRSNGDLSDTDSSDVEATLSRHLQDCPVRNMSTGVVIAPAIRPAYQQPRTEFTEFMKNAVLLKAVYNIMADTVCSLCFYCLPAFILAVCELELNK